MFMIYANQAAIVVLEKYVKREKERIINNCIDSFKSGKQFEIDKLVNEFAIIAADRFRTELQSRLKEDIERLDTELKDYVCNLGLELSYNLRVDKMNPDVNIILNIKE